MSSRRRKRRKTTSMKNKEGFQPLDERGYLQISVPGLRYESRDIIKIYLGAGGCKYTQAFYRSSGSNTKQTGTFMPFDGIGLKRKSGSFVHEPFLEKTHVQSLSGFTDLSDEGNGNQLSPKKFFSRLGNCHLGLISFLLGGPAWENLDTYKLIYLEKCKTKLESEGVDVNYLISQTPIIRDNLQKYNRSFYSYNSKKAQAVNIPVDNIVRVINDFVGTDTTINNFNSCRFTKYQLRQLGRMTWPLYPLSHKNVEYRSAMMIPGQGKRTLLKNIPKDPKEKEEQLARIRKRMEAMKKKGKKRKRNKFRTGERAIGKKATSKRKSKKKSRKNNVNNKKMKTQLDQKMLKELKLLQQEVSTINRHRISHLKSQHNRLEKRIVKGPSKNYTTYSKGLQTRMKQRLKRVDKSLNVYEKATRKKSRKVSRKSSRKRRSVKRKVSRKRRSAKRKVSRKRRSVKRKASRKRKSAKRKVSRKRKSAKRKSRKSSRKRRSVKKKR